MLLTVISILHIVICGFLICIVLLQQGKGADMGAAFGGGSNTLFGASGADNLLSRVTTVTAFLFMCTSVFLASSAKPSVGRAGNIFQNIPDETTPAPAPIDLPSAPASGTAEGAAAPAAAPVTAPAAPVAPSTANVDAIPAPVTNTAPAAAPAPAAPAPAENVPPPAAAQ